MQQNSATTPGQARKGNRLTHTEELVQTSFRLPLSRWRRLHELSLEDRSSVQAVIVAALEAEFERRGLIF
jgi:hypothetical protein